MASQDAPVLYAHRMTALEGLAVLLLMQATNELTLRAAGLPLRLPWLAWLGRG